MKSSISKETISLCYIVFSLLGLCLLPILTFYISKEAIFFPLRRRLNILFFSTICILGITAGIYPTKCSQMIHLSRNKKTEHINSGVASIKFEGHHPTCGNFSSHVLKLGRKTYCAGCAGLVTGAVFSLIGCPIYFFNGLHEAAYTPFFWLGFISVTCALLQYQIIIVNKSVFHFFLNVLFVMGTFLIFIVVNEKNSAVGVFLLPLIVYWIMTRVTLSKLEHKKICSTCGSKSCNYYNST